MTRGWLILIALLISLMSVTAQELEPDLVLAPFTLPDSDLGGVAPARWNNISAGVYVADDNLTYLWQTALYNETVEQAIERLIATSGINATPFKAGTLASDNGMWSLYTLAYQPTGNRNVLVVDIAAQQRADRADIIILQTTPDQYQTLRELVFTPAINTFGLSETEVAARLGLPLVPMTSTTLDAYNIVTDVPIQWAEVGSGAYQRLRSETDSATLIIQTTEELGALTFAGTLLSQLQLGRDLPEEVVFYDTATLEWSLYEIPIDAPDVPVMLHLGIAQDDERSYLVALLVAQDEAETLYNAVFLRVINVTRPQS